MKIKDKSTMDEVELRAYVQELESEIEFLYNRLYSLGDGGFVLEECPDFNSIY